MNNTITWISLQALHGENEINELKCTNNQTFIDFTNKHNLNMIIPGYYGHTKQLFNSTPIIEKMYQSHRTKFDK